MEVGRAVRRTVVKGLGTELVTRLPHRLNAANLVVLTYHGIVPAELDAGHVQRTTTASIKDFRSQLEWIQRSFTPVTLEAVRDWHLKGSSLPSHPILITFDDGYRNNVVLAAPLLKQYGIPATFFITTSNVSTGELFWHDELIRRLLHWPLSHICMPATGLKQAWPKLESAQRSLAQGIKQRCKTVPNRTRLEYIEYVRETTPNWSPDPGERDLIGPMDWSGVQSLVDQGFDIGSHTVTHPILSQLTASDLLTELVISKHVLESRTGRQCFAFAYPNGSDLNIASSALQAVRLAGYQLAFTVAETPHRLGGDPLMIARISAVGHAPMATFRMRVSGLAALLRGTSALRWRTPVENRGTATDLPELTPSGEPPR